MGDDIKIPQFIERKLRQRARRNGWAWRALHSHSTKLASYASKYARKGYAVVVRG